MMNLYMPASSRLEVETREFLVDLANELAITVESIRLRQQELTTLHQLHMDRPANVDLNAVLGNFLEQVNGALKSDFSLLVVQPVTEAHPKLVIRSGIAESVLSPAIDRLVNSVIGGGGATSKDGITDPDLFPGALGFLAAAPLELHDKPAIGALLLGKQGEPGSFRIDLELLTGIARQVALLIEQDQRMTSLEYTAVVNERSRLAREIHDGLAQTLAFLKLQTGQMQTYLNRGDISRLGQALQTNYQALAEAYLDIRQSIDNLRMTPAIGLENWLDQLALDFKKASGMKVSLDLKMTSAIRNHISTEIQAQLIRIVQEALSNIRKHARGERVWISLREWNSDIILEVRDDGLGFSPEDIPGLSQYGLRGMRERAELIGADFQIISQPQKGTIVRIRLPYPLEETLA
jgi:two-component system nitrate/nitrite sensor histidine kinase NarX